jgi:hypothetical protein
MIITLRIFILLALPVAALGGDGVTLPMVYHKDKLIVRVKTIQGDTLHFLFDTGSRDLLLDSAIAVKYQLINDKSSTVTAPFAKNIYLPAKVFKRKQLFADSLLNHLFRRGEAVNMSRLNIPSDIKIDGFIGISDSMKKTHSVLIDFVKNMIAIGCNEDGIAPFPVHHSVDMLYSDDGFASQRSKYSRIFPGGKLKLFYKGGHTIATNLIFDTGCHWEIALVTTLPSDSVLVYQYTSRKKPPIKYHDKRENVDYWMADSMMVGGKIVQKNIQTVYLKRFYDDTFGYNPVGVLLGAPFFKRYRQVYFNFPARRVDFVR